MDRRWRDSEKPLKVRLGRRYTFHGGIRVDEGEILTLKRRETTIVDVRWRLARRHTSPRSSRSASSGFRNVACQR